MAAINLFCIPFAGGSASIFHRWAPHYTPKIKVVPLELAGRGSRIRENVAASLPDAASDLWRSMRPLAEQGPFAIFGHSMGSLLAYEVALLAADEKCMPQHIFLSGRLPPRYRLSATNLLHTLNDKDFLIWLSSFGGMSAEILNDSDLLQFLLPIIRADIRNCELYNRREFAKLPCNFTILYGDSDRYTPKPEIFDWQELSQAEIELHEFQGGHFYINSSASEIAQVIAARLDLHDFEKPSIRTTRFSESKEVKEYE